MFQSTRTTRASLSLGRLLLGSLLLVACQPLTVPADQPMAAAERSETAEKDHVLHWGYEGEGGPAHWGDLSADYTVCADGTAQSPIDLVDASGEDLTDIVFRYGESKLNILNNGHTVQVNYDEGSSITVDGVQYYLLQFHFHAASEHTIAGEQYPLELHLVHRSAEGHLAVVGVMAVEGVENPAFADIITNAPLEETEEMTVDGVTVVVQDLLPADDHLYYAYPGSLTTPPCTEGVKWHVLTTPVSLSAAQIDALTNILHGNFRPVQPLHERTLLVDTTAGQ